MGSLNPAFSGGGGGAGGGLLYPDSADRPFASNSARNSWANNNRQDLIKDTTVVNVNGTQWYLWTGESNPPSVQNSLWMDAAEIVPGEKGDTGDQGPTGAAGQDGTNGIDGTDGQDGISTTNAAIDNNGDLIITLSDGSTINAGFVSGFDPKVGFELNAGGRSVNLNQDGALSVRDQNSDERNAIDTNNLNDIRVGSPNMGLELRTNLERITVENSQGDNELAYLTDIPDVTEQTNPERLAYWVRESSYSLSADDIKKEIILAVQPEIVINGVRQVTITFPNQAAFTDHYYVPDISPVADEATKPHINTFRFSIWNYYFQTLPVRVNLLSDGNWLPFVSSESLSETDGVYLYRESQDDINELHTFAFMRPINHNPAVGVQGWVFQNVHPYSWLPLTSQPPASPPISTLGTFLVDGEESSQIITGAGITSDFDAVTGEHTLNVDPTNIDLAGYAELDTNVSFSRVDITNQTDPDNFVSTVNVTNGGNTDLNLVGTSNIRKRDKVTGDLTDVANINGTSGALDLRTDVTYQGAITDDKSIITKEYLEEFGRGIGVPEAVEVSGGNTYQQTAAVALFSTVGSDINDVLIQLDASLLEAETIIAMPYDAQVSSKNFDIEQIAGQGTTRNIRAGDTWKLRMIVDQAGTNRWFWEKVHTSNSNIVYGLTGRNDIIDEVGVKAFAYAEGMPYHLLLETPTSSRLFHEFPKSKTHRFTPIDSNRRYEGVTINASNEAGPVVLGEYSDLPLYTFEPNQVVNRDQVGYINFPADMTIDTSQGFYFFGTVSGWAGGNQNDGTMAVYVGTNGDNPKAGGSKIGFALIADRLVILTGNDAQDAVSATASRFNLTNGVANFYRFAVYVDLTGLMRYYIVSLNTRVLHSGTQQCDLATVSNNPKLWVSYDREAANTSTVAVGEIHLVLETEGEAEQMWNWRN